MKSLIKLFSNLILCAFLISSCSENDEFKPYLKGDIIGYAYCFDEFGNKLEDFSGINVYTLPNRQHTAITDEYGRDEIKDVINGTYDLSFEKEGFGTMKLTSVQHLGGKPTIMKYFYGDELPFIYQNITSEITNIDFVKDTIVASVSLLGQYKPYLFHIRFFFSKEENFDIASAQAVKNLVLIDFYGDYKSHTSIIEGLPFDSGDKIYYKASIYTTINSVLVYDYYITGLDTYYDYDQNTTIYPNLSDVSEEFTFIMP